MAVNERIIKIGEVFRSKSTVGDDTLLRLHDVIVDETGESWGIGVTVGDEDNTAGIPYIVCDGDIDPEQTIVGLPKKGKK